MSLSGNRTGLLMSTKELSLKWERVKVGWKDSKSQEFEQGYIKELLAGVEKTVTVIERLDKLITKVRSDCE